jgi:drug/metabolite transporter (DMT)-like permease
MMFLGQAARPELLPSAAIAFVAATWGTYWLPLRHIDGLGLPATWATFIMVGIAMLALTPIQILRWRHLRKQGWLVFGIGLMTGTAFVLYSNSYAFTTIVNVLFLFYLTPIWATIMARVVLGEPITPVRVGAITAGFVGLGIILGGNGDWPIPRNVGDWMTLSAGILWSAATIALRRHRTTGTFENTYMFFFGGMIGAAAMPFLLLPDAIGSLPPLASFTPYLPWLLGLSLLWWIPSQILLMWGVPKVSPGRVGILLMAEALFGSITAALLSNEPFGAREIVGGALILGAALADTLSGSAPTEDVNADESYQRAGGT